MSNLQDLFSQYKDMYLNFVRSITQAHLISIIALHSCTDFPNQLPKQLKKHTIEVFNFTKTSPPTDINGMEDQNAQDHDDNGELYLVTTPVRPDESEVSIFAHGVLELSLALGLWKTTSIPWTDIGHRFSLLVRQQALVMAFAHIATFIADTLRIMCRSRREILRSARKTLSWEEVLQFHSMDDMIDYMIEKFIQDELGPNRQIVERLQTLVNIGVPLQLSGEWIDLLRSFERRRDLIVHSGGIVSVQYIQETGDASMVPGQMLDVSIGDLNNMFYLLKTLAANLFVAVASKFLNATKHKVYSVLPLYGVDREGDAKRLEGLE